MSLCFNCFREKPNDGFCPFCGYNDDMDRDTYPLALPHGAVLAGRYIVGRVLGQGGFGITYIAQDYYTKKNVAIKEFFPDTLATRTRSSTVTPYSGDRSEAFAYGKECFLEEAETLSQFIGNPNIVRIYSYFEENGTAYFAMEYIIGITLMTYLKNNGGKISFNEAKTIFNPIMNALSDVHGKGIIHRDLSPDNIFITQDGMVKLIDFGAARYSLGDRSRSLDVVLKHGYAPKEQYTRRGKQGPFTDVYSLGATIYKSLTGYVPPDSIDRMEDDSLQIPSSIGVAIPLRAEEALLKALSVMASERFQNIRGFQNAIFGGSVPRDASIRNSPAKSQQEPPQPQPNGQQRAPQQPSHPRQQPYQQPYRQPQQPYYPQQPYRQPQAGRPAYAPGNPPYPFSNQPSSFAERLSSVPSINEPLNRPVQKGQASPEQHNLSWADRLSSIQPLSGPAFSEAKKGAPPKEQPSSFVERLSKIDTVVNDKYYQEAKGSHQESAAISGKPADITPPSGPSPKKP